MEKEQFMHWLFEELPESLFSQIAAQVLFRCQNCRECCRGEGYALVDEEDIHEIARALDMSYSIAKSRFTEPDPEKSSGCRILKSYGAERSCCFLDRISGRCSIYHNRPKICRSFPMLSAEPEDGNAICLYSDCLGTASFARMILERLGDIQVKKDMQILNEQEEMRQKLKISLCIWLRSTLGQKEDADSICRITGEQPLQKDDLERYCLAYFLMTMKTDGLKDYLEAGLRD